MRITHCDNQFLVSLNRREASRLMDACALMVLAAHEAPRSGLPPEMASVLGDLFEGLRASAGTPSALEAADDQPQHFDHP